jgi:1-deoxy-D-xylulose-5-phosphate synthase
MNEEELRNMMYTAQLEGAGPYSIRYPRGRGVMHDWKTTLVLLETGKGRWLRQGGDIAFVTIGHVGNFAEKACQILEAEGMIAGHIDIRFLKPIDEELLHDLFARYKKIITVEDGTILGGLGSAVIEFMADNNYHAQIVRLGIPDKFIEQGTTEELQHACGFDTDGIVEAARKMSK